jgi:hypothetical protein
MALPAAASIPPAIPERVWARSSVPWAGRVLRTTALAVPVVTGLAVGGAVVIVGATAVGAAVWAAWPWLVKQRLRALEERIEGVADGRRALAELRQRFVVRALAPYAWLPAVEGRVHLRTGEGRPAAAAFTECGRMAGQPRAPEVLRAAARAQLLAGDHREAHATLGTLERVAKLEPQDELERAVLWLLEGERSGRARAALETLEPRLPGEPRVSAALALALVRTDAKAAAERLERLPPEEELDPVTQELVRRARKQARPERPKKHKRERTTGPAAPAVGTDTPAAPATAPQEASPSKPRSDRRKERRERRRAKQAKRDAEREQLREVSRRRGAQAREPKPAAPAPAPSVQPVAVAPAQAKVPAARPPVLAAPAPVTPPRFAPPPPVAPAAPRTGTAPAVPAALAAPVVRAAPAVPAPPSVAARPVVPPPPAVVSPPAVPPPPAIAPRPMVPPPPSVGGSASKPVVADDGWDDLLGPGGR